jgi:hypothetical protein
MQEAGAEDVVAALPEETEPADHGADYKARHAMEPLDLVEASEIEAAPWSIRRRMEALLWRWPAALGRQWPLLLVWLAIAAGLVLVYLQHWRRGLFVIGGAFGLAALFRLVLPEGRAGLLVVRSRIFDVAITGLAGAAVMGLALIVPPR